MGDDYGADFAIQVEGMLVVVGVTAGSLDNDFAVARLNVDGSQDTSFSDNDEAIS